MRFVTCGALSVGLALCAPVLATPTLQFDINSIGVQCINTGGAATNSFGGLTHTGSINFSLAGSTNLAGMFAQTVAGGTWANQNFAGSLSSLTGSITLVNGNVTGGSFNIGVNGDTDAYTCLIQGGVGKVKSFIGGGYTVQGLTFAGAFSDAQFGNVDVSSWFAANGALFGSFLEFNFDPDVNGAGFADMDIFVDSTVPLPPAAWAGLGTMGVIAASQWVRRRRR